jgi:hypothetical protein
MNSLRSLLTVAGCLSLLVGAGVLIVPAVYFYFTTQAAESNVEVTGTVTTLLVDTRWDSDLMRDVTYYCPIVEYATLDGQTFQFESNNCSTPSFYEAGDPVQVVYDQNDPSSGHMKIPVLEMLGAGAVGGVGLVGACVGIFGIILIVAGVIAGRRGKQQAV